MWNLILKSDHGEQVWVWDNEGQPFYFDKNETVRFRIESEVWNDQSPLWPGDRDAVEKKPPYTIQVRVAKSRPHESVLMLIFIKRHRWHKVD